MTGYFSFWRKGYDSLYLTSRTRQWSLNHVATVVLNIRWIVLWYIIQYLQRLLVVLIANVALNATVTSTQPEGWADMIRAFNATIATNTPMQSFRHPPQDNHLSAAARFNRAATAKKCMYTASYWILFFTLRTLPLSEQQDQRRCIIPLTWNHLHGHPTATVPMASLNSLSVFSPDPQKFFR